jgi:type II secretory pathway component PulC
MMLWFPCVKAILTALCSALLSEIGWMALKWADKNYQLINTINNAISNVISNVNIAVWAKQAAPGVFSAHIDLLVSAGAYVATASVVVCGVALGVKAYWKNNRFEKSIELMDVSNQNLIISENELNDELNEDLSERFKEKINCVLYQANGSENRLKSNRSDVLGDSISRQDGENVHREFPLRNLFS